MRPLPAVLLAAGLGLGLAGTVGVGLHARLATLEAEARASGSESRELGAAVDALRAELDRVRASEAERAEQRIELAEASLEAIRLELDARGSRLARIESLQTELADLSLDERLADLDREVDERWGELRGVVDAAVELADAGAERVDELARELETRRGSGELWRELMGPIVQLEGPISVGSGVLLESRPEGDGYVTHLLTAWHVVRDIQDDPSDPVTPVPVRIYLESGAVREETASVLRRDAELDVCLLVLDTAEPVPFGARLASRERLAVVRPFDPVWAVGCPLGTDPIPTEGQVASAEHVVDGERFWMINAPTYIGNSGGGIFDGETHELIGVFSKIYNHGSRNPTIVPHMGLVTPLDAVYDWLEGEGYASVAPADASPAAEIATAASAPRGR